MLRMMRVVVVVVKLVPVFMHMEVSPIFKFFTLVLMGRSGKMNITVMLHIGGIIMVMDMPMWCTMIVMTVVVMFMYMAGAVTMGMLIFTFMIMVLLI